MSVNYAVTLTHPISSGFVISFGTENTVKPKPVLKPRQSSITKIEKETVSRDSLQNSSPVSTRASSLVSTLESSPAISVKEQPNCDSKASPSLCIVCQVRDIDTSIPGGKICKSCGRMLLKTQTELSPQNYKGNSLHLQQDLIGPRYCNVLHSILLSLF